MELTAQEREAVERGVFVRYVIPDAHVECIVVREDLLDPLRVRSDYSACDPDDLSRLTSEVLDDEDWTMPERMGIAHVTVAIVNPSDPERRWEGLFLVDTGATDCYVPASRLHSVGIEPSGERTYELADGSELALKVGVGRVEFMGDVVGATVIFGEEDCEPVLGVTALESAGIEIDPVNQRLKRLPAVRLKTIRGKASSTRRQSHS